jgi:hypothetical protein
MDTKTLDITPIYWALLTIHVVDADLAQFLVLHLVVEDALARDEVVVRHHVLRGVDVPPKNAQNIAQKRKLYGEKKFSAKEERDLLRV